MNTIFGEFFILILMGFIWRFIKGVPSSAMVRSSISSLVLNLLLPSLTFGVIYNAPFNQDSWEIPLIGFIVTISCIVFSWGIYTLIKKIFPNTITDKSIGSIILGASWGNSQHLGLPVLIGVVGSKYAYVALLYSNMASTPLLFVLGSIIAGYFSEEGMSFTKRCIHGLKKLLILPPLIAMIAAFICRYFNIEIHPVLLKTCSFAGNATSPLMMISLGMALSIPKITSILLVFPAAIIRNIIGPLIAYLFLNMIYIDAAISESLILEAGMPSMILALIIAEDNNLDTELLAQLITISTLLSFITLPFLS